MSPNACHLLFFWSLFWPFFSLFCSFCILEPQPWQSWRHSQGSTALTVTDDGSVESRKVEADPQVAVAFQMASLLAASADVVDFDAADKVAISKATATCDPVSTFRTRRRRSWAFHRALICHSWGGTTLRMPPRLLWPKRKRQMVMVNIGRPILRGKY